MLTAPEKPKHYNRDYFIIALLACLPVPIALYYDIQYLVPLLPIVIVTVLPHVWFRAYYAKRQQYKSQLVSQRSGQPSLEERKKAQESQVNANIARYLEKQKAKKAGAK